MIDIRILIFKKTKYLSRIKTTWIEVQKSN